MEAGSRIFGNSGFPVQPECFVVMIGDEFLYAVAKAAGMVLGILFLKTVSTAIGWRKHGFLVKCDHGVPGAASFHATCWTVCDGTVAFEGRLGS